MSAVIKVHAHICITGLKHSEENSHVSLCSRMRLNINVVTAKQLLGPLSCKFFNHIHTFAAAVVSLTRISFGIFIGKGRTHSCHNSLAYPVFGGDQLNMAVLSCHFRFYRGCHLGIYCLNFVK